jgi:hypothetical protein
VVAAVVVGALLIPALTAATERLRVPDVPDRVRASDGAYLDKIRIDWGDDAMADSWQVYRAETESARTYSFLVETTARVLDDTDIVPGKTYWYVVKACNLLGCGDASDPESGFAQVTPPDFAPLVTASDGVGFGSVQVAWTPVPRAAEYEIYRTSDANARTYDLLVTVPSEVGGTPLPLVYNDVFTIGPQCRIYWYWVRGCNVAGCGPYSEPDSGFPAGMLPAAPANPAVRSSQELTSEETLALLLGPAIGEPFLRLTWDAVLGVATYRVTRQLAPLPTNAPPPESVVRMIDGPAFLDTDILVCQSYSYTIAACNGCGCGAESPAVEGRVVLPPPTPTLTASDGEYANAVRIAWTQVPGATLYTLQRSDDLLKCGSDATWCDVVYKTIYQSSGALEYYDTSTGNGQARWYRVAARTCIDSAWSAEESGFRWIEPSCHVYDQYDAFVSKGYLPIEAGKNCVIVNAYFGQCLNTTYLVLERQEDDGLWEPLDAHWSLMDCKWLGDCTILSSGYPEYSDFDVYAGHTYRYRYRPCSGGKCSGQVHYIGEATIP